MSNAADQLTQDIIQKYQDFLNPTQVALLRVGGFDHIEVHAEGLWITDADGNRYVDCLGGYGVFSLGHRHPRVVDAVKQQLDRMPLSSKTFLNQPMAELAAKLAEITPGALQYSFFCNSGTEAVEGALKLARMSTGRTQIIATSDAYHGKTMGALSATGRDIYRKPFAPLVPEFVHVPWNDADALAAAISNQTAAVILEPVQGEGGIRIPSDTYLREARSACDAAGALLILDEVQTGLGRTGKRFASEHWNVVPDIMTLAKCLGGGVMPIGAFMATAELWDKMFRENPFIHSSTFGGNQLACAAALEALAVMEDEDLVSRSASNGAFFLDQLTSIQKRYPQVIREVRGLGLMLGIEFSNSDFGKVVIGSMVHKGVIAAYTLNNPNVIRIEPPLTIDRETIKHVAKAINEAVAELLELLGDLMEWDDH